MADIDLWDAFRTRTIFAFHGNIESRIAHAKEHGFRREGLPGDWLGGGWYFWQEAPVRAWQWADHVVELEARSNLDDAYEEPMVLIAELEYTEGWVDLIDSSDWFEQLRQMANDLERLGLLPDQAAELSASALHERDYAVIEAAMDIAAFDEIPIDAIRCAFVEGHPIVENSAIHDKSHVQIAVRNPGIIRRNGRIGRRAIRAED